MNKEQYRDKKIELIAIADSIEAEKQPAYTVENLDVLYNFKLSAELAGITPMQSWSQHFIKQVQGIMAYIKTGKQSEPIESRFADALNYLTLGYAIIKEDAEKEEA